MTAKTLHGIWNNKINWLTETERPTKRNLVANDLVVIKLDLKLRVTVQNAHLNMEWNDSISLLSCYNRAFAEDIPG